MRQQIKPPLAILLMVVVLTLVIGVGWYLINPPPGPIGPPPGTETMNRHLGDGRTGGGFKGAPGRRAVTTP